MPKTIILIYFSASERKRRRRHSGAIALGSICLLCISWAQLSSSSNLLKRNGLGWSAGKEKRSSINMFSFSPSECEHFFFLLWARNSWIGCTGFSWGLSEIDLSNVFFWHRNMRSQVGFTFCTTGVKLKSCAGFKAPFSLLFRFMFQVKSSQATM